MHSLFLLLIINFLSYYPPLVEKRISYPPLLVAKDGQLLRRNMRREFLTEEELMEYFRRAGIEDAKDGRAAHVEANGHISLIRNKRSS
ncbi:DUF421 domain-containing protein [Pontibacter sp. FD36]|uniref:YetF domain-containing protein n=1 Tax=Pontibacter sp. FD36 TaxID=2789860 RepID=UPI0018AADFC5|nr:DUF421 domain-containing protein [Pontibacter sp. FD36]